MKVREIKGEIGSTGKIGRVNVRQHEGSAILDAVEQEHAFQCRQSGDYGACDITNAADAGFPHVAAFLLQGATETPLLGAVLDFFEVDFHASPNFFGPSDEKGNFGHWQEWHREHGFVCDACNSVTYAPDDDETEIPSRCGNCRATEIKSLATRCEQCHRVIADDPSVVNLEHEGRVLLFCDTYCREDWRDENVPENEEEGIEEAFCSKCGAPSDEPHRDYCVTRRTFADELRNSELFLFDSGEED